MADVIEVVGPGGRRKIPASELRQYQRRGYQVIKPPEPPPKPSRRRKASKSK